MTLDQALRVGSILLAASGLTALVLTGEVPVLLVILAYGGAAAGVAAAFGYGARLRLFHLSAGSWNAFILVALIGFVAEAVWLAPGLLEASIHFLIVLMINKMLTLKERKDFPQLYVLSLLAILAAAAMTVDFWYATLTAVFLLAAVWSLMLYHLVCERDDVLGGQPAGRGRRRSPAEPGPITLRLFWTTNAIAVGGLCLTMGIFFLTPRIGAGVFQKQRLDLIRTSGFSDRVDLGVIGAVKLDQSVVMRVEFPDLSGPPSERLYFRGAAYDRYSGMSWSNSFPYRHTVSRSTDGVFRTDLQGTNPPPAALRQEILIEALDTPVLFGVPFVQSIEGNFFIIQADGMGGLSLPNLPATRLHYTAYSSTVPLPPHERTATASTYPEEIKRRYLQLPAGSERVRGLAEEVTREAKTVFERITMVQSHLRTQYRYSLDVGSTLPRNPVDEFLFVRKTGYCEHYATAMVLMLRMLGIPSRLVTGFLHGEWNDFGNYYTVRQRDAHAWVEVYFPQSGWRTFDPTPVAGIGAAVPIWSQTVRLVDSVRLKWDRFVIRYSLRDQLLAVQEIRERGGQLRDGLAGLFTAMRHWVTAGPQRLAAFARSNWLGAAILSVAGGLMVLGVLLTVRRIGRARPRQAGRLQSERHAEVGRIYRRMMSVLAARGLRKAPGTTPLEFARQVSRLSAPLGEIVHQFTTLYCRVRFHPDGMSPDDRARAQDLLMRIRRGTQSQP